MAGILVLILILMGTVIHHNVSSRMNQGQNWQQNLQAQDQSFSQELQSPNIKSSIKKQLKEQLTINQYRLKHNIAPSNSSDTALGFTGTGSNIMEFVTLFIVIMAGGIVSSEFSSGTIKLLLIRPYRRGTILLSKYLSVIYISILYSIVCFVAAWIIGGLFFGFSSSSAPYLSYSNGIVHEHSLFSHLLVVYANSFIQVVMFTTIAFMISSIFRNTALAIGLSIFGLMGGQILVQVLAQYHWVKYILFTNIDLSQYFSGQQPIVAGTTIGFSVMILILYYIVFMGLTWWVFSKRDVAA